MTTQERARTAVPMPLADRSLTLLAGATGLVSAVVTFAVAALLALLFGLTNPIIAVGSAAIDLAPPPVKDFAIALFGTGDKAFLITVLVIVCLVIAPFVGILQRRRPPLGMLLLLFAVVVATVASLTRAHSNLADAAPALVGAVVGILLLRALISRLDAWRRVRELKPVRSRGGVPLVERRSFLQLAIGTGFAGLVVATGASLVTGATAAVSAVRAKVKLPPAATPAAAIPADADLHESGLPTYITPNADFYRIDTALQVPSIDPAGWTLKIGGMVENPFSLTFKELEELPLEEHVITPTCVSQEVGGNLISNAKWLGYPIRELLARAKPTAGADMVLSTSIDGFTAGSPLAVLQDDGVDALLAIGMNGEALPLEHGFPARLVVPGLYGYVSATKWVVNLKVTTFAKDQGYWTPRGWSAMGPIKISSRIDTPKDGFSAKAGTVMIAGVAWHQHTGIQGVQVQVDGGSWQDADLAAVYSIDTWLQWSFAWQAKSGGHTIAVRAIGKDGQVQTAKLADPAPNGSTGLHTIHVTVT